MLRVIVLRGKENRYTLVDEELMLVTYSLQPIISTLTQKSGIEVEHSDISEAGRVLAQFADRRPEHIQKGDRPRSRAIWRDSKRVHRRAHGSLTRRP